jgi:hypothetical protein
MKTVQPLLKSFLQHAYEYMHFNEPIHIKFNSDHENSKDPLGKTAYYDPDSMSITIFTDARHPKDIMRSISHELVHHAQNCRGEFNNLDQNVGGDRYFQNNPHMREMEREAYQVGNMCFRDWEENYKSDLRESRYYYLGDIKMDTKEWKNRALFGRLLESFGYGKPDLEEENVVEGEFQEDEVIEEECVDEACGDTESEEPVLESAAEAKVEEIVQEILKKYSIHTK